MGSGGGENMQGVPRKNWANIFVINGAYFMYKWHTHIRVKSKFAGRTHLNICNILHGIFFSVDGDAFSLSSFVQVKFVEYENMISLHTHTHISENSEL